MWQAIIGAALSAGSSVASSLTASAAAKKKRLYLDKREKELTDRYNDTLGDLNQSASAQRAETKASEDYQRGINTVNNSVTGGQLDRAKMLDSVNQARADQASQIAAQGEAQKAKAKEEYYAAKDNIEDARQEVEQQKMLNTQQNWQNAANIGMNLATADIASEMQKSSTGTSNTAGTVQNAPLRYQSAAMAQYPEYYQKLTLPSTNDLLKQTMRKTVPQYSSQLG